MEIVATNGFNLFHQAPQGLDPQQAYALRGYRRIVLLTLHNYGEVVLWFAIFYCRFGDHFTAMSCSVTNPLCALYFSLVTMATVGYGDISPKDPFGRVMVCIQISLAIFLTLIILARVVGYLPQPPSLDPDEKRRKGA
jgi:hypothetical protein